jgi:hypothetical protein
VHVPCDSDCPPCLQKDTVAQEVVVLASRCMHRNAHILGGGTDYRVC